MVTALLLTTLLTPAKRVEPITLATDAVTVQSALTSLSEKTGSKLLVQSKIANEIVVVKVKDADPKEVLDRFAKTLSAHWEVEDGGFRLVRSESDLLADKRAALAERRKRIASILTKLARDMNRAGTPTLANQLEWLQQAQDEVDSDGFQEPPKDAVPMELIQSPEARFAARLLLNIGVDNLLADNATFATSPTSLQRNLPLQDRQWQSFVQERNDQMAAYAYHASQHFDGMLGVGSSYAKISGPFRKVLLTYTCTDWSAVAFFKVFDRNGSIVAQGGLGLNDSDDLDETEEGEPKTRNATPIPLEDEALQMALLEASLNEGEPRVAPPSLLEKLRRPDRYEPLSLLTSKVVLALADRKKENLIAYLSDDSLNSFADLDDGAITYEQAQEDLDFCYPKTEEADGWMLVRPADAEEATLDRANRKALADLIDATYSPTGLSLDDYAKFALASGDQAPSLVSSYFLIATNEEDTSRAGGDWTLMKLYATLSQADRKILAGGGKIYFGRLSSTQRDLVVRYARSSSAYRFGARPVRPIIGEGAEPAEETAADDLAQEPTEFLCSGLNPDGWVSMETTSSPTYDTLIAYKGRKVFVQSDPQSIAMNLFSKKHPEFDDPDQFSIERIRKALNRDLIFSFHIREAFVTGYLGESRHEAGNGCPIGTLPSDIKSELDKLVSDLEEQLKNGELQPPDRSDQGNGGVPPP